MTDKTLTLYWSATCAPCRILKPELRRLCDELGLTLVEKNVTEHREDVVRLGLRGLPSVVADEKILFTGNLARSTIVACLQANEVLA
jgi:thiol-disulfide isomerase/thioredoxin